MVGITNRAFRGLIFELGAPAFCFTEMASAEAYVANAHYEAEYTDAWPAPRKTSVQFVAKTPDSLVAACEKLNTLPDSNRPAGIDINMGCSAPHIRKSGAGSAWGADPEGAAALVSAARRAWPGILSAKIRMGVDDEYGRILDFCAAIAEEGLDFLTIHPRVDSQKFRRKPHHDITQRLASDLRIPLIANGDIIDYAGYEGIMKDGNVFAVMIGREAVRRPWVFNLLDAEIREAPTSSPFDRLGIGLRFLELVESMLPEVWRLETSRRFFSYFCEPMSFAHHVKFKLMNCPSLAEMRATLSEYLGQVPNDRMVFPDLSISEQIPRSTV
jgi:tRNA-dihydrouridine synthase